MSEYLRIGLACALGLLWSIWVLVLWLNKRPKSPDKPANKIVAFASQTGQARWHAENFLATVTDAIILPLNQLSPEKLQAAAEVHLFVSTYGDGEAPDNGRSFIRGLNKLTTHSLNTLNFKVTAFGDSHYPAYCAFGKQVFAELVKRGAKAIQPLVCIDAQSPPTQNPHTLASYTNVSITDIQQLNAGSSHAGLYLIELSAPNLNWKAGDILEVLPPSTATAKYFESPRSYSIASADSQLMANNQLKLLVRLLTKDDGSLGLASSFLTQTCQAGSKIQVKVRANPACQLKSEQKPLLLIGAGSGLAGLIGHIEQRSYSANAGPVWLIYGERDPQFDCHMHTELTHWQQQGVLTRVDRVFSRATPANKARYVHELIAQQAENVQQFVDQGADIYVCGSHEGMGKSVDNTLIQIFGEDVMQRLNEQQRYHRDLY
ncbi:sulfite reductase subunit alpha [Catenovulum agarivorans DS-2]|uniref:NADPH--hemoprotein reductase n=1 Tax=Catenovulum agarivorans DS-2 TaxID=1328313 RepID=W7Q9C2_9ALTE|nr:NADPH cytochrome P450 oxidoreductase family protein [Catenovulum agarivorans]EWH09419.1 sulfite reductase subunit alpha [Catenovulum agarivorans DS-2]